MHMHLLGEVRDAEEDDAEQQRSELANRILTAIAEEPMTRARLREVLGIRNERLGEVLEALQADGRLTRSRGRIIPVPNP